MSTIPFPAPENREQAKANMFHWAAVAEEYAKPGAVFPGPGQAAIEKAKMWAAIALAMPQDMDVIYADDRPLVGTVQTPQIDAAPSGVPTGPPGVETIDSRSLAALKAVTIRCIETHSLRAYTTVNMESPRNDGVLLVFEDTGLGRVKITMEDQN